MLREDGDVDRGSQSLRYVLRKLHQLLDGLILLIQKINGLLTELTKMIKLMVAAGWEGLRQDGKPETDQSNPIRRDIPATTSPHPIETDDSHTSKATQRTIESDEQRELQRISSQSDRADGGESDEVQIDQDAA
ncbi:MAG: hypothetical protein ACPGU7_13005 [Gammaproteobacteria bacterium]